MASTPAMRVVATAPMPGIMMPSFPVWGLMLAASWVAELGVDDIVEAVPFCAAIFRVADRLVSLAERRGRNFTAGIAVR